MERPPDKIVIPWTEASVGGHIRCHPADPAAAKPGRTAPEGPVAARPDCVGTAAALFCETAAHRIATDR